MRYKELFEKYTSYNSQFRNYMKEEEFDPYAHWWYVCNWIVHNCDLEDVHQWFGNEDLSLDVDELNEEEPTAFFKMPPATQKECANEVLDEIVTNDPAEAPTWKHMHLDTKKLLPRTSWLVHFSDDAGDIWHNGFIYGADQMDRLGLTTYFSDKNRKSEPGYNFAFEANSRDARIAEGQGKYGRNAVLFQNSGVRCDHFGDEEEQVVFWGEDVNPKNIVFLKKEDGDWNVMSRYNLGNGGNVLFTGDFTEVVKWVQANSVQYRKYLFGK